MPQDAHSQPPTDRSLRGLADDSVAGVTTDATPPPLNRCGGDEVPRSPFAIGDPLYGRKQLGHYELLEEIGRGGMGVVFKARHPRMERVVAIKVLSRHAQEMPELIDRFRREVQAAGRLMHPNIVVAHDADEAEGIHFLVMEFVDGSDLATIVERQGQLPIEQAVRYMIQAAEGLAAAHAEGIVHRDIKPGNLLLSRKGTVKVLDLGLAHLEQTATTADISARDLTKSEIVMGTAHFMSPEQALDCRKADARADIYSLGCTFYYLLSGEAPYGGTTTMERIVAHREDPIPRLRESRPDVPEIVDAVVTKMLAKRVEDRYQTMSEVVSDLNRCLGGDAATGGRRQNFLISSDRLGRLRNLSPARLFSMAGAAGLALAVSFLAWQLGNSRATTTDESRVASRSAVELSRVKDAPSGGNTDRPPLPAIAPFGPHEARQRQESWAQYLGIATEWNNSVGMKMRLIPPGEFQMGSNPSEVDAALAAAAEAKMGLQLSDKIRSETPQHRVILSQPLAVSATEVTVGQFRKFVDAKGVVTAKEQMLAQGKTAPYCWHSPGYELNDELPVTFVTLNDADSFCEWLTEQDRKAAALPRGATGRSLPPAKSYRLPTEAEWEFACRAGTTSTHSFEDSNLIRQYAWSQPVPGSKPHEVATKLPNPFGLFDMHGNTWEWCSDFYDAQAYERSSLRDPQCSTGGTVYVVRGGGWSSPKFSCRSAVRDYNGPSAALGNLSFRVVCTLELRGKTAEKSR